MDAKEILGKLLIICESAKKLAVDPLFVDCLNEEIVEYWKSNPSLNEGKVVFSVDSSGDTIYEGTMPICADNSKITVDIQRVVEDVADPVKVREFINKSAEDLIGTLQSASDRSRSILENMEIATKAGEIDLQTKKRKLLDKLLGAK